MGLWSRIKRTFRPSSHIDEMQEELQFHLEMDAADGHDPRAARLRLGNLTRIQEDTRDLSVVRWFDSTVHDVRYAWRTLVANKTFSLLAILSLALGIGANTAIYSFMDSLLLRSLPVSDPDSLAVLNWGANPVARQSVMHSTSGSTWREDKWLSAGGIFPYPAFELIRDKSASVFSSVFTYYPTRNVNLMVKGVSEQAGGEYVSGEYFQGLEVLPAVGRLIHPDDDRIGASPIVVLSHTFSQKRFGEPSAALGQAILINNVEFTVAGVTPPGFFGVDPGAAPDFYLPLHTNVLLRLRGGPQDAKGYFDQNYYWLEMMARLKPGVTREQAQAVLAPQFHQWASSTAANDRERVGLPELQVREGAAGLNTLRRQYSKPLYVLLAMVGLILAIACANIASLLLARATARRREMAVRLSMGAGRLRVIRQLLTESVLLASLGGAAGVAVAIWGISFLTFLLANGREDFTLRAELNWHVLAAAVGLSVLTGLLFGLAPALQSTRVDVMPTLKETRAGQPGRQRFSLGQLLVVVQIGLSLLMLVGAGLFVETLSNLQAIQLGFNRQDVLLFKMNAHQAGHRDPEIVTFYSNLRDRFNSIPGVISATAAQSALLGEGSWSGPVVPAGQERKGSTHILMTTNRFFETMQIPVTLGRSFDERDKTGSLPVAIVSESYVKKYFPDRSPLGQHISIGRGQPTPSNVEIVGVAKDTRYGAIKGDFREIAYVPFNQGTYYPIEEMSFALRTQGDPLRYVNAVRAIVTQADVHLPVTNIRTQVAQIDQMMNQEIILARLCTGFAILALLIACVGLYGTMSYTVARRTSEIGIRMALGAQRGAVVWMVLRQACILSIVGLVIGVPTALSLSKFVESFLFGVKPNSIDSLALAVIILLAAVLAAGYVPAWKASRIDPMIAVRHE